MSIRRRRILLSWLLGALVCVVLAWQMILPLPARPRSGVSISLVGITNAASGAITAQFTVSNAFGHGLLFAGGAAAQIRGTNGWPVGGEYGYPLGPVFTVAPNTAQTFAITLSNVDGAVWRVPLAYSKVDPGIARWCKQALGWLPLYVAEHKLIFTNTPEMVGLSNHTVQRTGASRFVEETNRTSSAAGSRR